jgi:hypothetical protein
MIIILTKSNKKKFEKLNNMRQALRQSSMSSTHIQPSLFTTTRFKKRNNSIVFKLDMELASEMEYETSIHVLQKEIKRNHFQPHHQSFHLVDRVSRNKVGTNRLYQVSPAQLERMKHTMSGDLLSHNKNYELVKRLESVAARHSTSVPIVIKSWKHSDNPNYWFFSGLAGNRVELSTVELSYLNEVYN